MREGSACGYFLPKRVLALKPPEQITSFALITQNTDTLAVCEVSVKANARIIRNRDCYLKPYIDLNRLS